MWTRKSIRSCFGSWLWPAWHTIPEEYWGGWRECLSRFDAFHSCTLVNVFGILKTKTDTRNSGTSVGCFFNLVLTFHMKKIEILWRKGQLVIGWIRKQQQCNACVRLRNFWEQRNRSIYFYNAKRKVIHRNTVVIGKLDHMLVWMDIALF